MWHQNGCYNGDENSQGKRPYNFEPWSDDKDTRAHISSLKPLHHTIRRMLDPRWAQPAPSPYNTIFHGIGLKLMTT
ncbi:hypothetical protein AVEN_2491-1 [Araneus ventricosus]|uniref:Uncharacterized protein n=1 Tax=Araneus ventricosus TaxID=182803 RepID=A0A4Y2QPE4_ARAVE|nr:hypothetical protein AVEN_2491-1 [Araneus ventricosus]